MLKVDEKQLEGIRVLYLHGWIDGSQTCDAIHQHVKDRLDAGDRRFLVNLSDVSWSNSLGLGCLIASYVTCVRRDAHLEICSPSRRIETEMRISRLIPELFTPYATEAEALKALRERAA
jgi:anti-anti-sigma factor